MKRIGAFLLSIAAKAILKALLAVGVEIEISFPYSGKKRCLPRITLRVGSARIDSKQ